MRYTNAANIETIQLKCIELSCSKCFHKNSSAVFKIRSRWPNFELIRDFIVLYLPTKFYQIPIKTECARVFTSKMLTERQTTRHDISSSSLWPVELKISYVNMSDLDSKKNNQIIIITYKKIVSIFWDD